MENINKKWNNSLPKFLFFQLIFLVIICVIQYIFVYNIDNEDSLGVNIITSLLMSVGLGIIILRNYMPNSMFLFRSTFGGRAGGLWNVIYNEDKEGLYMNKSQPIKNYIIGSIIFLLGFIPSLIIFLISNKLI